MPEQLSCARLAIISQTAVFEKTSMEIGTSPTVFFNMPRGFVQIEDKGDVYKGVSTMNGHMKLSLCSVNDNEHLDRFCQSGFTESRNAVQKTLASFPDLLDSLPQGIFYRRAARLG